MLHGGNRKLVPQALPKKMNIKLEVKSQAFLKEMLRKNSRYGLVDIIINEALVMFYFSEKKRRFR